MKRFVTLTIVAAFCASTMAPHPANALNDDQKKGLAALLAIGIAIAAAKKSDGDDWDEDRYGKPFSPSGGVICLPKPQQCYKDGHYSYRWTRRIFGG